MILGFKLKHPATGAPLKFVQRILSNIKIHTLRTDERWKKGVSIQMAIGVRTKHYKQFNHTAPHLQTCTGKQKIEIRYIDRDTEIYPRVWIDGKPYRYYLGADKAVLDTLAVNDGFDDFKDFCAWFNTDWTGYIIHWTDFRY